MCPIISAPHAGSNVSRSPDGSVILAQCEDRTFQSFNWSVFLLGIDFRLKTCSFSDNQGDSLPSQLNRGKTFVQASPILDFIWFPTASPYDPASFCFVASVRECPVRLFDASDGRVRLNSLSRKTV
jgi:hypothetical protein